MASENSKTDENSRTTELAVNDYSTDLNAQTRRLRVKPSTNELTVVIYAVSPDVSLLNQVEVDQNSRSTSFAVTDDVNEDARPLQVDSRNGYLYCDVT